MAVVMIVTIGGSEYEITDDQIQHHLRCDGCGEYLAADEMTTVTASVHGPGARNKVREFHYHEDCLRDDPSNIGALTLRNPG